MSSCALRQLMNVRPLPQQEIVKFCGGNKQMAADLIYDLDEDQDGEVSNSPGRKRTLSIISSRPRPIASD